MINYSYIYQIIQQNNFKMPFILLITFVWIFFFLYFWVLINFMPIKIFFLKYSSICLQYFKYICKIEVSLYLWLPIFSSLGITSQSITLLYYTLEITKKTNESPRNSILMAKLWSLLTWRKSKSKKWSYILSILLSYSLYHLVRFGWKGIIKSIYIRFFLVRLLIQCWQEMTKNGLSSIREDKLCTIGRTELIMTLQVDVKWDYR